MMSNRERMDFVIWAEPLFPKFTTKPALYERAVAEWEVEKRIRAYEDQGMTRGDAQGVVEAEMM
jgi:hypothetical protein